MRTMSCLKLLVKVYHFADRNHGDNGRYRVSIQQKHPSCKVGDLLSNIPGHNTFIPASDQLSSYTTDVHSRNGCIVLGQLCTAHLWLGLSVSLHRTQLLPAVCKLALAAVSAAAALVPGTAQLSLQSGKVHLRSGGVHHLCCSKTVCHEASALQACRTLAATGDPRPFNKDARKGCALQSGGASQRKKAA